MALHQPGPLEAWAGLECTLNRVGDRFIDQCVLNGHDQRIAQDVKRFASLGVKRVRYPILWEKVAPESLDDMNWSSSDEALKEFQAQGVMPIAGLVHHGSGPKHTSLLDPEFPEKLAAFALKVAERYPWIDAYTPVNEPLTTARFSGLYGVWYPHHRTDESFVRCLYNELKGVVLAMRAIRTINPNAALVQTEDFGLAKGTPPLQYQVDFENMRRWLTFDFLCGRIDKQHYLYRYLMERGKLTSKEILWFQKNSLPPDIIGINHYPLSNRFIDHRLDLYPPVFHGGNGRDAYADVGSVDTGQVIPPTPLKVFRQVWERYRRPIAITEAHIAGPRESQVRWLKEIWSAAEELRAEGGDVRAVTSWSLLGSYGWNTLCTAEPESAMYESGVFDARTTEPRETAIAKMVRGLASESSFEHPLFERGGYWTEPSRILFAPPEVPPVWKPRKARPILITGASGSLGRAFTRVCQARGLDAVAVDRSRVDICSREQVAAALAELKPWAVINAAGYSKIEQAERERHLCYRDNAEGARVLAEACALAKIPFLTFSSDLVFDGGQREPYGESSAPSPLNVYGHSKVEAERSVREAYDKALIVRTSSLFSPWDDKNFLTKTLRSLRSGQPVRAIEDIWASPTYVPDLVNTALDLLIDGEEGLLHLTNEGIVTWSEWARLAAEGAGVDPSLIEGVSGASFQHAARRPTFSALKSDRLAGVMPKLDRALSHFIHESSKEGLL